VKTVQKAADLAVQAGRRLYTDSASSESQSVQTTEQGDERGSDGGKNITGRTRHVSVDVLGLLVVIFVSRAAGAQALGAGHVSALGRDVGREPGPESWSQRLDHNGVPGQRALGSGTTS
jgi:hypothetical protein